MKTKNTVGEKKFALVLPNKFTKTPSAIVEKVLPDLVLKAKFQREIAKNNPSLKLLNQHL